MQPILGKSILPSQRRKRLSAFLFLSAGDGASGLPRRISPLLAQALLAEGEHRVVKLPACFQMCAQAASLAKAHLEGQFQQKGRGPALLLPGLVWGAHALRSLRCHAPAFLDHEYSF